MAHQDPGGAGGGLRRGLGVVDSAAGGARAPRPSGADALPFSVKGVLPAGSNDHG